MGCGTGKLSTENQETTQKSTNDTVHPKHGGSTVSPTCNGSDYQKYKDQLSTEDRNKLEEINNKISTVKDYKVAKDGCVTMSEKCREKIEELSTSSAISELSDVPFMKCVAHVCLDSGLLPDMLDLLKSLVKQLINSDEFMEDSLYEPMEDLFILINNICYNSSHVALRCLELDLLEFISKTLKHLEKQFISEKTDMDNYDVLDYCISISSKCALSHPCTTVKEYYDRLKFADVLKPFLEHGSDEIWTDCLFCLSSIVDLENDDLFTTTPSQVAYLKKILERSLSEQYDCNDAPWTLDMLLKGLGRLAVNDANKKSFLDAEILPMLVKISKAKDVNNVIEVTKLMFSLSMCPKSTEVMKKDTDFIENLKILVISKNDEVNKYARCTMSNVTAVS